MSNSNKYIFLNKKIIVRYYVSIIIVLFVLLLSSCRSSNVIQGDWETKAAELSKIYGETTERIQIIYDYYGNWCDVEQELRSLRYSLTDKELLEAINSGVRMDEITELMCIARSADVKVVDLIKLKREGKNINEIQSVYLPQRLSGIEEMKFVSDGYGLGYYIWTDERSQKQVTNYKLTDFLNIRSGMREAEVRSILDGRLYNRLDLYESEAGFANDIEVYELVSGGEVHIYYYLSIERKKIFPRVYYLEYRPERKYTGKTIYLVKPGEKINWILNKKTNNS